MQKKWYTMKRINLWIIGIEGEEFQVQNIINIWNKITEENFPNLEKEIYTYLG